MNGIIKRAAAVLLAVTLLLTAFPLSAQAEDNNKEATLLNVDIDSGSSNKKTNRNLKNVKKVAIKQENKQEKANKNEIINDAVNALVSLGFSRQNIYNDVFSIVKNNDKITTEEIVKEFLKKLDK